MGPAGDFSPAGALFRSLCSYTCCACYSCFRPNGCRLVVSKCVLAGRYRSAPFWFRYARACGWHQSDAINALCCGLCKIMSWIEKALYGLAGGLVGRFLHGAYQPCSRRCDGFRIAVASSVGGVWFERVKHATFNTCAPGASFRN